MEKQTKFVRALAVGAALLVLPLVGHAMTTTNLPTSVSGGTGAVANIQTNDALSYTVAKGATASIGGFAWIGGAVTSVVLHVEFSVASGYDGTHPLTVNGLATSIIPVEGDSNRAATLDITGGSFSVDTWPEIKSTKIGFINNDTGGGSSVSFDYVYLVINHGPSDGFIPPTWSDEFNGTGPADPEFWTYEEGYQRNNEAQYYVTGASNGWQEDGNFVIEARREPMGGYEYTSASIYTIDKYYWKYGRAQIRARIPCLPGMWPAIWGCGEDGQWPHNGEVDIMEYYNNKILANCAVGTTEAWTAKWDASSRSMTSLLAVDPNWKNEYHIWSIQWDEQNVRLYVDNVLMNIIPQTWLKNTDGYNPSWGPQYPFKQPFLCWLNLAIGGNAGGDPSGTSFPQRYYIDYWRVWEGATNNVAPTDISLSTNTVGEGLPSGTVVGYLSATDADPAEVIKYTLVTGTGGTHNNQFSIPEFISDNTTLGVLKTAAVLNYTDGATRSIRVRATDIVGATFEKVLTVNVIGDPVIEVSSDSLQVPEGSTDTFDVRLRVLPQSDVTVNVTRDSGDTDITVHTGATLTFTPANGTDWQTVTIAAAEDADTSHGTATILCSDPAAVYASETVSVSEIDNDNLAPTVDAGTNQSVELVEGLGGGSPVAGAYYEWDAALDTAGDNTWPSTGTSSYTWTFDNTDTTAPEDVTDTRFDQLLKAYALPAAKDASNTSFSGNGDDQPATFELVLDVDGNDGSIFETGGSGDGLQIDMSGGAIRGTVQASPPARASYTLTPTDLGRFIHVVFVVDSVNDVVQLYVDGVLKDWMACTRTDWSGTGAASLGSVSGDNPTGGSTADFTGKIALFRYYRNKAFTSGEVTTNFNSISTGAQATANLDGTVSDPESDPLTTTWTVFSGPATVGFADKNAVDTTAIFSVAGTYVLRLTADDGPNQTYDDVTITVRESGAYSVTYDENGSNGGSVPEDSNLYAENDTVTVLGNTGNLVKSGYTFAGWNTQSDGNGITYGPSSTFLMGTLDVTFYAKWSAGPTYALTVTSGTGDGDYAEGTVVAITADAPATGYHFDYWSLTGGGLLGDANASSTTYTMSAGNATLTANYGLNNAPIADAGPDQTVSMEIEGVPWTPTGINTDLWLDASDAGTIVESGGAVSRWNDKSGKGLDVTQANGTYQPTTGTRTIGGLNVLDCDGGDALNASVVWNTANISMIGVFEEDAVGRVFSIYINDATSGRLEMMPGNAGYRYPEQQQYAGSWRNVGNPVLASYVKNGTSSQKGWGNGRSAVENTATLTTFDSELFTAGAWNAAGSSGFNGGIGEIIIIDSSLSDSDRQKIEGYLAHKWGLAANLDSEHRYKSSPPMLRTVSLDGTGSSDPDGDDLTYEWTLVSSEPAGLTAIFNDSSAVSPTVTFSEEGTYTLQLTVDDGSDQASDTVVIIYSASSMPLANLAPDSISDSAATLNAALDASGTEYDVYVYYGTTDGGTNAGAWATNVFVGSYTNISTNLSYSASFAAGQTNYYTFMASNATETIWASPSWMFSTPGEPVPTLNLTVNTEHGTAVPSGLTTPASNSVVNALIIDSPVLNGNTQYVCTGWVATGSAPASGSTTNMSFNITNDTTLIWQWQTNYWVDFEVIGQ